MIEDVAHQRRSARGLTLLAALVLGLVVADVVRRAVTPARPRAVPAVESTAPAAARRSTSAAVLPLDSARRAWVRTRIQREGTGTYVGAMLAETDSALRRWPDERRARPLRVAVLRRRVDGYREEFPANVAWAVGRWNGAAPVPMESGADSASADILVSWVAQLDSGRSGRTDLTWDQFGRLHRVSVVLATHTPAGRPLDGRYMSALALHELGHALGLGHSPVRDDVMHRVTTATELSERDRRSIRLLYDLPSGSIR
jgi:hypothetical protein